jgi:hypothetical protein
MRFLKVLVIAMGVLIVVATTVLVVLIAHRLGGAPAPVGRPVAAVSVLLDEPAGTRIVGIAAVGERLAVQLQGGGADRVVLVDPRNGEVVGRIGVRTH